MSRGFLAATVWRGARVGLIAAVALLGSASVAVAAPTWLAPFEPLPAASSFVTPALNAGGEVLFSDRTDLGGGKSALRVSSRPPGGSVGAPVLFPPGGSTTLGFATAVALADDGHAIATWSADGGAFYALRSPAGAWGAPAAVPGAANVTSVVAGIDATGIATLGWAENSIPSPGFGDMNVASVKVVRISPGGSVSGSQTLLSPPASSQTTSVTTLRVAGPGPAIFTYSLGSFGGFSSLTAAFRDTVTGSFGNAADLGTGFGFVNVSGDIGDSGRSAFVQPSGANIALRVREPGGALGGASNVGAGGNVFNARAGLAGDGAITVAWDIQGVSDPRVLACRVVAGDCAGDPQRLSSPQGGGSLSLSSFDVNAAGAALVAWNTLVTSPAVVFSAKAALRPGPDAAFGPAQDVAPPPAQSPSVALDAAGDGVATFNGATGPTQAYKAAGLDAAGPRIDGFSAPGSVAQGTNVQFSAGAVDVWSPFGLGWSFGDGATAAGGAVSHVFSVPGLFPVTVTATDAVGNSSSRSSSLLVRDTVSPQVLRLTSSHARFRVGARPTAKVAAGRRRAIPRGTAIRYTVSEAGAATFAIDRATAGRRVGRACRKPTRANRRRHACRRYVRAGTLTRRARAGANSLAFSGRIGRKALAAGSYRLTLTVRDGAGNASRPKSLTFTIVSSRRGT